jgi:hypothetical protein
MRIDIAVTMGDGTVFRGTTTLSKLEEANTSAADMDERTDGEGASFNFSLPTRAFMKRYAEQLSGPKKLTLLIAHMAQGKTEPAVPRADVERLWKKMSGLLGGAYNAAYDTRARDNGWISSPKAGTFKLLDGWANAIRPNAA